MIFADADMMTAITFETFHVRFAISAQKILSKVHITFSTPLAQLDFFKMTPFEI